MYHIFHRTWWTKNKDWPNGLEPGAGNKHTIQRNVESIQEARRICEAWCKANKPGKLSDKAEFETQ